ncbi:MAG: LysR family transcriptional regulator [Polyangiaceae bacterium]
MRLEHLDGMVAFLAVAEQGGFSSAARTLGISPSAVSQAIRTLEARLDVSLFTRTTRAVRLSEAGTRLYERCAPGLRETVAAIEAARAGEAEPTGRLRLSVPHIAVPFLEPILVALRQKHPRIVVEMLLDDRFVDLVKDGYDAGIRLFESMEKDMVAVRMAPPFRFVIVGSPQYFRKRGRPKHPKELLSHDCIGFREMSSGALYAWEFEHRNREFRVPVEGTFVSNEAAPMVRAAEHHWGLAYVPDFSAQVGIQSGRLETVLDDFMPGAPGLFLYFPKGAKAQGKVKALLEALKTVPHQPKDRTRNLNGAQQP